MENYKNLFFWILLFDWFLHIHNEQIDQNLFHGECS